jgi:hypothetical protein
MTQTNYATYLPVAGVSVVDRGRLQKLSTNEFATALKNLYVDGRDTTVKIVDSSVKFFSKAHLKELLDDPDNADDLVLVLEQRGITLTDEEFALVRRFNILRDQLLETATGPYPLATVPEGWTLDAHLTVNKTIRRKRDSNYSIGVKTLRGLWEKVAPFWADHDENTDRGRIRLNHVQASGYNREANATPNMISIGCQNIHRYEVEAVAIHLGWEFPTT